MTRATVLAIIGGSGIATMPGFTFECSDARTTRFGAPSAPLRRGRIGQVPALFLARHGEPHHIAPHRVNYRANLWALRAAGATHVIALNTVGGISDGATDGALYVPRQLIDYTWGRESTYHDGVDLPLYHQEFAEPYAGALRARIVAAASASGIAVVDGGVYGCTQGPRLETAAEIARMERDGCDLVGMTGMPEAALAAELGLAYAAIALVVNRAAGKTTEAISFAAIAATATAGLARIATLVGGVAAALPVD